MSRFFATVEGCVKNVIGIIEPSVLVKDDVVQGSSQLEIQLESANTPVKTVVCDALLPIEKGEYIRVQVEVTQRVEHNLQLSRPGAQIYSYCHKARALEEKEDAYIIEKIKGKEVVATYKLKSQKDKLEEAYEQFRKFVDRPV